MDQTNAIGSTAPAQFDLTEEQRAIFDMAKAFAAEEIAPHAVAWDEAKTFPTETLRKAAALGLAAIYTSEEHGGSGMSRLDAALIFEALATGCPTVAAYLSIHNMTTWMIDRFGTPEQRERFVPRLARMGVFSSYCLTEPGAGSDAAALRMTAREDGEAYVLNGVKQFISGAGVADIYVVMARTGGPGPSGVTAFIVEKGAQGVSFGPNEKKMGWNAQPTRQVILEDVRLPKDHVLGELGRGFNIAMASLDGGRLNMGAASIGGGQAALDRTLGYMGERKAFGRRLADFQALQFRLADMATELEAARCLVWRAAAALDARSPDATKLCAMAKRFATDAGFKVANEALQLHGGYGYFTEYGIEKIVRDLRVHQILEGSNEIMRLIVSRSLLAALD